MTSYADSRNVSYACVTASFIYKWGHVDKGTHIPTWSYSANKYNKLVTKKTKKTEILIGCSRIFFVQINEKPRRQNALASVSTH